MKGTTAKMEASENRGTDGKHDKGAQGNMRTVKRAIGGRHITGPEKSGGCQGSKGLSGADPN